MLPHQTSKQQHNIYGMLCFPTRWQLVAMLAVVRYAYHTFRSSNVLFDSFLCLLINVIYLWISLKRLFICSAEVPEELQARVYSGQNMASSNANAVIFHFFWCLCLFSLLQTISLDLLRFYTSTSQKISLILVLPPSILSFDRK